MRFGSNLLRCFATAIITQSPRVTLSGPTWSELSVRRIVKNTISQDANDLVRRVNTSRRFRLFDTLFFLPRVVDPLFEQYILLKGSSRPMDLHGDPTTVDNGNFSDICWITELRRSHRLTRGGRKSASVLLIICSKSSR